MALGYLLYGAPLGPDAVISWWSVAGAFLIFSSFLTGLYSAGSYLALKANDPHAGAPFAYGALLFCFLAALLGHLGFIAFSYRPLAILLLLGASILGKNLFLPKFHFAKEASLLFAFAALTALLYLALSFTLDSMPDPLYVYLTAPRIFSEAGSIHLPAHFPIALQSGLWEYLFLWGNMLLGSSDGGGLIVGQFFGQWLHLLLGVFGSVFALRRILLRLIPSLDSSWLTILLLFPFLSIAFANSAYLAKNDWGAIFFALTGLTLLLEDRPRLAGIFWGAAFTVKYSIAFSFLGFFLLWRRCTLKSFCELSFFALLSAMPILFRNALFTGNPLFPTFNQFFHSPFLGPSWEGIKAFSGTGLSWSAERFQQISLLFRETPLVLLSFFLLPALLWRAVRAHWRIAAAGFFPLILFLLFSGTKAEVRLIGAAFFFVPLFALLVLREIYLRYAPRPWAIHALSALLILLTLLYTKHPLVMPFVAFQQKTPAEEIRSFPAGMASAWLRLQYPEAKVASGGETRLYYLLPLKVQRIWDNPEIDRALWAQNSVQGLYRVLDEAGFDFLLLTSSLWDTYYDQTRWDLFSRSSLKFPQAVPFQTETERVIDIKAMRRLVDTLPGKP